MIKNSSSAWRELTLIPTSINTDAFVRSSLPVSHAAAPPVWGGPGFARRLKQTHPAVTSRAPHSLFAVDESAAGDTNKQNLPPRTSKLHFYCWRTDSKKCRKSNETLVVVIYRQFDAAEWINPPCFGEERSEAHSVSHRESPQTNLQMNPRRPIVWNWTVCSRL